MRFGSRLGAAAVLAALVWAAWPERAAAHKTVISKFTYFQDVLPILQARCGSCHRDGGVAGTLLTYDVAKVFPWGLEQELLSRRMPPWPVAAGLAPIKGHEWLSPREFDTLITWAAGGTPAGTPVAAVPLAASSEWPLGEPDVIVPMPVSITLAADQLTLDQQVELPIGNAAERWIRAIDVQPGNAAIVRRAAFESGGQVIAWWLPGERPHALEGGGAFRVPARATLRMHVRYKRTAVSGEQRDLSRVGIYFAPPRAARPVDTIVMTAEGTNVMAAEVITRTIDRAVDLVAVRPVTGPADANVAITLIDPAGRRSPLMRLLINHDWPRRYVLERLQRLEPGSRVEVSVAPPDAGVWESLLGSSAPSSTAAPVRIALETVR